MSNYVNLSQTFIKNEQTSELQDQFILELNKAVNTVQGKTFEITFQVGSLMISGTLIGGHEYYKEIIKQLHNSKKDTITSCPIEDYIKKAIVYYSQENKSTSDIFTVLHVRDAKFYPENSISNTTGPSVWRARASCIDGFMLGRWNHEKGNQNSVSPTD